MTNTIDTRDRASEPGHVGKKVFVLGSRGIPNVQGGVETHCQKLYPHLVRQGYDVTVIGRKDWVGAEPYDFQGVKVLPTWAPKTAGLEAAVHTFLGVLKAWRMKADLVHIHAVGPSLWAPLARMLRMKVVVTHHGPDYDRQKWSGLAKRILKTGESMGVQYAHRLVVISETIRTLVEQKYRSWDSRLIFNGVDIPEPDAPEAVNETLRQYGLEGRKYILTVGRLVPEKGFHDLIEAMGGRDDVTVVIAGNANPPTEYSQTLTERAKELDVVMTGFVKGAPLRHLFRGASLFVLPSYHEGLPIALLEAMSFGKDVLVSDIAANRDVKLPQAHYFQTGSVADLHRKALARLAAPATATATANSFVRMVQENYDWDTIAWQTNKLYQELLPAARDPETEQLLIKDLGLIFERSFALQRIPQES